MISMENPHVSAHNEEFSDADFISKSCKKKKSCKMSLLDADSMLNLPIEALTIRGKSASYPIGCRFGVG